MLSAGSSSGDIDLVGTTTAVDQVSITAVAGSINGAGQVTGDTVDLVASSGIGNSVALETVAAVISADATSGNIEIDNVLGTPVDVTLLRTGSGSVQFSQSGGDVTFSGPVSSGGVVDGGNITLTATSGLVVDGPVSSVQGTGGMLAAAGATLNGTVTVGAGDISIQGGGVDLLVVSDITSEGDVTLSALRDVIVSGVVDANNGSSVTATCRFE